MRVVQHLFTDALRRPRLLPLSCSARTPHTVLRAFLALLPLALAPAAGCSAPVPTGAAAARDAPLRLVWEDTFDRDGRPDAEKWAFDEGGGGWGNDEIQTYTTHSNNARVEGGRLVVEAREDERGVISSARLTTRGRFAFTGGRVEVVARPACFTGSWSAFWLLPDGFRLAQATRRAQPPAGEIDLLEHLGRHPGHVFSAAHAYGRQLQVDSLAVPKACDAFHTYRLDWSADTLATYVDGQRLMRLTRSDAARRGLRWPFGYPYVLVLNVAVGGRWAARDGIDRQALRYGRGTRLEIDAVRVYRRTTPSTGGW